MKTNKKLFRVTCKVNGREYVDWYTDTSEANALNEARLDANCYGIPETAEFDAVECDSKTLKPIS